MTTPHEQLAGYRQWVADGAHGPDPIEVMTHGGHSPAVSDHPIHALSADLECAHGRVPIEGCEHDCFAPQPIYRPDYFKPTPTTPDLIETMKPKPKPKRKPKPTPMPPLVAAVVSDLDREIDRLREARRRVIASQKKAA